MKYHVGFILLEASIGVALFTLVMMIILQGMTHINTQCIILKERHRALCAMIYTIEQSRKNIDHEILFPSHVTSQISTMRDTVMPYTHSAIQWHSITTICGSQSVKLYYAEYEHAPKI